MNVAAEELLGKGRVVLFSVPGAFTPTCSAKHLPGFIEQAAALKAKGVDKLVCLAVNDVFVMDAWGKCRGRRRRYRDGGRRQWRLFARARARTRCPRHSAWACAASALRLVIEDGVVKQVHVEAPGEFKVSSAEHILGTALVDDRYAVDPVCGPARPAADRPSASMSCWRGDVFASVSETARRRACSRPSACRPTSPSTCRSPCYAARPGGVDRHADGRGACRRHPAGDKPGAACLGPVAQPRPDIRALLRYGGHLAGDHRPVAVAVVRDYSFFSISGIRLNRSPTRP